MHELAVLLFAVLALMAVTAAGVRWIGPALRALELLLLGGAAIIILFEVLLVCADVLMRYGFNSPIPGQLEGSELLMPLIVFLAFSYTQATNGHVGMDLLLANLAPRARRLATMGTLLVSIFVCAVIAYFSARNALQLWRYDDVTMTPPYFHTWPSAAAIPVGYGLSAFRMFLQFLTRLDPERFPAGPAEHRTFTGHE
ncbi:MAG: TRAP transporter small permease subunit [Burkholderiales bacterium]